jgi:hypothetical protein
LSTLHPESGILILRRDARAIDTREIGAIGKQPQGKTASNMHANLNLGPLLGVARTSRRAAPPLNSGTSPTSARPCRMLSSVAAIRCRSPSANTASTCAKCALSSVASCSTHQTRWISKSPQEFNTAWCAQFHRHSSKLLACRMPVTRLRIVESMQQYTACSAATRQNSPAVWGKNGRMILFACVLAGRIACKLRPHKRPGQYNMHRHMRTYRIS